MPPKRKPYKNAGRPKRARASSPNAEDPGPQSINRPRTDEDVPPDVEYGKAPTKLPKNPHDEHDEHDEDADGEGEDDKMCVDDVHDEDADGEKEDAEVPGEREYDDPEHGHHDGADGDGEGEDTGPIAMTTSSLRGRGRGRPRRAKMQAPAPTRSSPRKTAQLGPSQLQTQPTSKPVRGRKAARGRGKGATDAVMADQGEEPHDEQGHQQHHPQNPHRPPHIEQQQQQQQQQQTPHPHQQLHPPPPPSSYPAHAYPAYPSYPSHVPPYPYVCPPHAPPHADGRPYLTLRPDGMYNTPTSFVTTAGTTTAASSFSTAYADPNLPQGNPFPVYGAAVYGVGTSASGDGDGDGEGSGDEEDTQGGKQVGVVAGPAKKALTGKVGGRAGRGDHVACHFCRGRKLKCDGRRPTCGHCALRSLACAYDETVRRRGPGRKEKNNRRSTSGVDVVVPDLQGHVAPPSPATETSESVRTKRKRRPPGPQVQVQAQAQHSTSQSQTGVLRFDDAEGGVGTAPGGVAAAKPASAAYGVESNERLGYYYTSGPPPGRDVPEENAQFAGTAPQGHPYPPYGAPFGHGTGQPAYGFAQDGAEAEGTEGNADADAEAYGPRPGTDDYGPPPNGSYSHAWPAEPPGGVPIPHAHTQHM